MIVQTIRSLVFYALFFTHTFVLALIIGLMSKLVPSRRDWGWALARYWSGANLFFLRWIVGIRTEVSGQENIPAGGSVIAAKHMSDWDIFAILPYTNGRPSFIAKRELLDIPLFGWSASWFDTISVDRKRGKDAFPLMVQQARDNLAKGCRVVIFPEGTRRAPLDDPAYRTGLSRMYVDLDVPVVPVAVTSGLYWPRNSPVLWPGTARARFLPAIPAGLSAGDFQRELISRIEAATNAMVLEDARAGLARPIPPRLRERIDALEAAAAREPNLPTI